MIIYFNGKNTNPFNDDFNKNYNYNSGDVWACLYNNYIFFQKFNDILGEDKTKNNKDMFYLLEDRFSNIVVGGEYNIYSEEKNYYKKSTVNFLESLHEWRLSSRIKLDNCYRYIINKEHINIILDIINNTTTNSLFFKFMGIFNKFPKFRNLYVYNRINY